MRLVSHSHVDPLFCSIELAGRIERAEAHLIAAGSQAALRRNPDRAFVTPVAGGFACFGEDGAPFNKVVGLGFGGIPSDASLDGIEAAYAARADAAAAGCDVAVVTTAPGSKSQQNVHRQGFHLLYTRAVLVKDTE